MDKETGDKEPGTKHRKDRIIEKTVTVSLKI